MVEQTGTNETAGRAQENGQNTLAPAPGSQHALAFGADGSAVATLEPADAHDGRRSSSSLARRSSRFDTRRTAEYLAERGRTPAESLHLIARKSLPEAMAYLRKHIRGVSDEWCAGFYLRCITELAPYVHAPVKDLDLPATADALLGGIHAHFLAASAASARLAQGVGAGMSRHITSLDIDGQAVQPDGRDAVAAARASLPPKGKD